ncbi:MAG: putative toxin-antitoxin system toxin component, PIN family [Steroidobacteraceae bacterium]
MKLCLDTNVLISAFLSHGLCEALLRRIVEQERHQLLILPAVLEELQGTLQQKFAVPAATATREAGRLAPFIAAAPTGPLTLPDITDRADAVLLATAAALNADYFITGDQELLALGQHEALRVVSPRQFWALARLATD